MKNILIATNLLFLGLIIFMACNQKTNTSDAFNTQRNCQARMCKDYSGIELKGIITGDLIEKMSLAYSKDLGKSIVNYNPASIVKQPDDALSISFDMEKIKNFIWRIENAVCHAGCDSTKKIGIRFYYIKYDTTGMRTDQKIQFEGNINKHSLAMVPVYFNKSDKTWYDFNYQNVGPGCKLNNILSGNPTAQLKEAGLINDPGDGDNHGGMAPPPKPATYPLTQE